MQITTIGLDIAENVFQVHGIDAAEKVVVRKRLQAYLGLQVGEVVYGDVGSRERLDFTVIGPTVNEAGCISGNSI